MRVQFITTSERVKVKYHLFHPLSKVKVLLYRLEAIAEHELQEALLCCLSSFQSKGAGKTTPGGMGTRSDHSIPPHAVEHEESSASMVHSILIRSGHL